jgi:putative membrane protein
LVALLAVVTSHSDQHRDRLAGAIVNNDDPVTFKGSYTPLGRELSAKIMAQHDTLDWSLMTSETAETKMRNGEVVAIVTIPQNFSAKATSMATDTPTAASRAVVHVRTSDYLGVSDSAVVENVTQAGLEALNNDLRENYLDNVYIGFSDSRKNLGIAASGAQDLADGAGQVDDGASSAASGADLLVVGLKDLATGGMTLTDGMGKLAVGAETLHSGTARLASTAPQLTSGSSDVASGARDLSAGVKLAHAGIADLNAGASQLATGLAQLDLQTSPLPAQAAQLSGGALSVLSGAEDLSQGASQAAQGAAGVSTGSSQLASALADHSKQMSALALAHPDDSDVQQAAANADKLAQEAEALSQGAQQSSAGAEKVSLGADSLVVGAGQVDAGASQLAAGAPLLATGVSQLSVGATRLSLGLDQLYGSSGQISTGAVRLASGSDDLAKGTQQFSAGVALANSGAGDLASATVAAADGSATYVGGVNQAKDGGVKLASGVSKLSEGTGQVRSGGNTLAEKLSKAVGEVPDYSKSDRNTLKKVVSSPAELTAVAPAQMVPWVFFALLTLWLLTLGVFGLYPPLPRRLAESTLPTWQLALEGARPAIAAGVSSAVLCSITLWLGLELDPSRALALCAFLTLSAVCFAFVNQALVGLMGSRGALLSLILGLPLIARALFSTIPAWFVDLYSATPLGAAWDTALRLATGGTPGVLSLAVVAWGLTGAATVLAVVSSRRMTTGASLRHSGRRPELLPE